MILKFVVVLALAVEMCSAGEPDPKLVLKRISATIGEHVLLCREEMPFGSEVIRTFLSYWSAGTPLAAPALGCAVACVLRRLRLLGAERRLSRANADAFFSAKGADKVTREILIELYELCRNIVTDHEDCSFGVKMAKCFRGGILMRGWAPDSLHISSEEYNYYDY